eukprot:UN24943
MTLDSFRLGILNVMIIFGKTNFVGGCLLFGCFETPFVSYGGFEASYYN